MILYLYTTVLLWKSDLNLDLKTSWSHQSIVDHVLTIGHAYDLKIKRFVIFAYCSFIEIFLRT